MELSSSSSSSSSISSSRTSYRRSHTYIISLHTYIFIFISYIHTTSHSIQLQYRFEKNSVSAHTHQKRGGNNMGSSSSSVVHHIEDLGRILLQLQYRLGTFLKNSVSAHTHTKKEEATTWSHHHQWSITLKISVVFFFTLRLS
jgi:hypothetical protein